MSAKYDPDYARGIRGPLSVLGRGAWLNIVDIRKCALALEKRLRSILIDSATTTPAAMQDLARRYLRPDTSWKLEVVPEKR